MSYIEFKNVTKTYCTGKDVSVNAATNVSFNIENGEFVVILGPSGAGKTTILNLLGGMDSITSGVIRVDDTEISSYNKKDLTEYRRNQVGFVFQFYNLVSNLTALENIELASQVCDNPLNAKDMIKKVGLGERIKNFPAQLSGGEQQRVAIARALSKNPKILLCDEPTGALDSITGKKVMKILKEVSASMGHALIVVTHNSEIAKAADRIIKMKNGVVKDVIIQENPIDLEELQW
jgi:putative ABC transport system ATP-binding protein